MKRDVRFLGVDDGPFQRSDAAVRLVGVVTRGAGYVEGVLSDQAAVDGDDATEVILRMVRRSKFRPLLRALFLNGVAVGGFNVVDLDLLQAGLGIPVVTVARDPPRPQAVKRALRAAFADWEGRWRMVQRCRPQRLRNGSHTVYVTARGLPPSEVKSVLERTTVRGAYPEALRLAHVIASGLALGESRGQA